MSVRLQTEALDVRRFQLPRIRLKALEAPDFVEIGRGNAAQDGRRGPPSGRGALLPLAPNNRSRARPCPPVGAFGHRAPVGKTNTGLDRRTSTSWAVAVDRYENRTPRS